MSNKNKNIWKYYTWIFNASVTLGPKRVQLSEIKEFKSDWQHVQPKVNDQRKQTLKEGGKEKKSHKLRITKVIGIMFNLKLTIKEQKYYRKKKK